MARKADLITKLLLAIVALLLGIQVVRAGATRAQAEDTAGPPGSYQVSAYVVPPTDTRPHYVRGYFVVDTRTGQVDRKEENVW